MKRFILLYLAVILVMSVSSMSYAQRHRIVESIDTSKNEGQQAGGNQSQQESTPESNLITRTDYEVDVSESPERTYIKNINEETIINIPSERISVSNPRVITANVLRDRSGVLVTMLAAGRSELRVWDSSGNVHLFNFIVKGSSEAQYKDLKKLLLEIPTVTVEKVNEMIVVKGTIQSSSDLKKFNEVISRFDVINYVEIKISEVELDRLADELREDLLKRRFNTVDVEVKKLKDEKEPVVWLTGFASTDQAKREAEDIALMYFPNVVSHIQLQKPMIELDCIMVTVDDNMNFYRGDNTLWDQLASMHVKANSFTGNNNPLENGNWWSNNLNYQLWPGGIDVRLRLSKEKGKTVNYIEQHQTVLSGQTARFQDGGTIYVKLDSGERVGLAAIEHGLMVNATPKIQENGRILTDLDVNLVVPQSQEGSENINTKTFHSGSTLECRSGQTIVVSGINSDLFLQSEKATPFLEKIPVINLFFKSKTRANENLRSYLFVTPTMNTTVFDSGLASFSKTAPEDREKFEKDSKPRKAKAGYYLGWEDDIPEPDEEEE